MPTLTIIATVLLSILLVAGFIGFSGRRIVEPLRPSTRVAQVGVTITQETPRISILNEPQDREHPTATVTRVSTEGRIAMVQVIQPLICRFCGDAIAEGEVHDEHK
jgi:hypothetical protein